MLYITQSQLVSSIGDGVIRVRVHLKEQPVNAYCHRSAY